MIQRAGTRRQCSLLFGIQPPAGHQVVRTSAKRRERFVHRTCREDTFPAIAADGYGLYRRLAAAVTGGSELSSSSLLIRSDKDVDAKNKTALPSAPALLGDTLVMRRGLLSPNVSRMSSALLIGFKLVADYGEMERVGWPISFDAENARLFLRAKRPAQAARRLRPVDVPRRDGGRTTGLAASTVDAPNSATDAATGANLFVSLRDIMPAAAPPHSTLATVL